MVRILILWPFIKLLKEPLDKNHILYWTAVILSSLILTVTNAGAEVLDGLIIGYPTTYIVGVIGWRLLSSALSSLVIGVSALAVIRTLRALSPYYKSEE